MRLWYWLRRDYGLGKQLPTGACSVGLKAASRTPGWPHHAEEPPSHLRSPSVALTVARNPEQRAHPRRKPLCQAGNWGRCGAAELEGADHAVRPLTAGEFSGYNPLCRIKVQYSGINPPGGEQGAYATITEGESRGVWARAQA